MTMTPEGLLIDGIRTEGASGQTDEVINPADGAPIASVTRGDSADVDRAVTVARHQFSAGPWHSMNPVERGEILMRISHGITQNRDALALAESQNAGKPISAALGEIDAAARTFQFYAGAVDKFHGQTIPGRADGTLMTFREPLGVVGIIVPWNFPMLILAWKLAPALALGNTVVAKPAGVTPLTALMPGDLAIDAGLQADG